ncbi:MAG: hypothetical protein J7647_16115 [Cyanobacteria bacterium SBLK]|nr:hypothetical protein [Cyanobacteria bacterium SBLK]
MDGIDPMLFFSSRSAKLVWFSLLFYRVFALLGRTENQKKFGLSNANSICERGQNQKYKNKALNS